MTPICCGQIATDRRYLLLRRVFAIDINNPSPNPSVTIAVPP